MWGEDYFCMTFTVGQIDQRLVYVSDFCHFILQI